MGRANALARRALQIGSGEVIDLHTQEVVIQERY